MTSRPPANGSDEARADPRRARPGLPDQVVSELLRAVARGEHPPGSRLPPEADLAASAKVSRLTLREAVKVLRDKGVLRVEQGRGTFVNPPERWSALDAELLASRTALEGGSAGLLGRQLVEARRVVEVGIAGLAAERRSADDLEGLQSVVELMRSSHGRGAVAAVASAARPVHEGLPTAAANPFLAALFEPIRTLVHQVRVTTAHEAGLREKAIAAHSRILEAVAAGHAEQACEAMAAHIDETHRAVLDAPLDEPVAV